MRRTILDHTPDGLKRRLAELERRVADLQRKGDAPASYVEPAEVAAGGGKTPFLVAASDASDESKAASDYLCDGVADDVEIQTAVDAALAAAAGQVAVITLSEGTFVLAAAVDCTDGSVCFRGGGPVGSTTVKGTAIRSGITLINYGGTGTYYPTISNIYFWQGYRAISCDNGGLNMRVHGCWFEEFAEAIRAESLMESHISDCNFYDNSYGIRTTAVTYRTTIANNTFWNSLTTDMSLVEPGAHCTVSGNSSQTSAQFLHSWGFHYGLAVTGNTAQCDQSGGTGAPVLLIDGNYPGGGASNLEYVVITGNTFDNGSASPGTVHITNGGSGTNVAYPVFTGNTVYGPMYLDATSHVMSNQIVGGIHVTDAAAGSLVANNVLGDSALWGSAPPYTLSEATAGNAESGAGNLLDGLWTP